MRLSKQQKKILIFMNGRNIDTTIHDIKAELWGTITAGLYEGGILREYDKLRDKSGNYHYSVKRSVLNLLDKKLITVELKTYPYMRSRMCYNITDEGSKCVEKILHNKDLKE